MVSKREAQHRADRIQVFREELEQLERENVLTLTGEQRDRLHTHHEATLKDLARRFDVDISQSQRQISWGMRIASLLGGLALCAAVVLFFYRYWGILSTPLQVAILILTPLLCVAATEFAARRERTLYYAVLFSLVACAAFILNLSVLGSIFNITPSENALLAWALFALALAYTYRLCLPLLVGLVCMTGYLASVVASLQGWHWASFGERPENVIVAGILLLAVPSVLRHREYEEFPHIYWFVGLLSVFVPILILSTVGMLSYLPMNVGTVETIYQLLGFLAAAAVIWRGIAAHLPGIVNLGAAFFTILLFIKFVDWWWDWMPKYLFFLAVGLILAILLGVFRRLRVRMARGGLL